MNNKAHALARDELIRVLTAYKGITTSDGEADGTTLIDSNLRDNPAISKSAIPEKTILIMSGDAIQEDKGAASFDNATGAITLTGTGFSAQIKAGTIFRVLNISTVEMDVARIEAKIDTEHETEWATTPVCQQITSADAANLTAGSVTPTFPTGSTRVRAILIATIHAANQGDNTHHINLKVQGQKAAGGYGDLLDLSAVDSLGLVNVDGAADGWCAAIDVTALVDTSAVAYDFRFVVDSDNAGAVNYTTSFTLVLVYKM